MHHTQHPKPGSERADDQPVLALLGDPLHGVGDRLPLVRLGEAARALQHVPRVAQRGVGRERLREPSALGSDALGHAAAFVTLLPIFAGIFLGTWLLARRELRCGVLVVGYVANAALCDQLKHLYRQPRPPGATLTDYGMPSNHSQTTCFLLAYGLCFMWSGAVVSHATCVSESATTRGSAGGAGAEVPFLSIAASASVRWVFARTLVRSASSEPGIPEFSVEPHRCGASFQSFLSRRQGDFCRRQAIFWSPSAGRRVP